MAKKKTVKKASKPKYAILIKSKIIPEADKATVAELLNNKELPLEAFFGF